MSLPSILRPQRRAGLENTPVIATSKAFICRKVWPFMRKLAEQVSARTGERLSKRTLFGAQNSGQFGGGRVYRVALPIVADAI